MNTALWLYYSIPIGSVIILFLVLAYRVFRCMFTEPREIQLENVRDAKRTVESILRQIGQDGTVRWVGANEMEFVSIILGQIAGKHRVWARVRTTRTKVGVTVEFFYDADQVDRMWANIILEAFRERGVEATIKSADSQPHPSEIKVFTARHQDELP